MNDKLLEVVMEFKDLFSKKVDTAFNKSVNTIVNAAKQIVEAIKKITASTEKAATSAEIMERNVGKAWTRAEFFAFQAAEAAEKAAAATEKVFAVNVKSINRLGREAKFLGTTLIRNVTLPLIAMGVAAIKMADDVLTSNDAIARLSIEGQLNAFQLKTALVILKDSTLDLRDTIVEGLLPAMIELTTFISNDLIPILTLLAEEWGKQSEGARATELAILGITATIGPITSWVSDMVIIIAGLTIALGSLAAAAVVVIETLAILAAVSLVAFPIIKGAFIRLQEAAKLKKATETLQELADMGPDELQFPGVDFDPFDLEGNIAQIEEFIAVKDEAFSPEELRIEELLAQLAKLRAGFKSTADEVVKSFTLVTLATEAAVAVVGEQIRAISGVGAESRAGRGTAGVLEITQLVADIEKRGEIQQRIFGLESVIAARQKVLDRAAKRKTTPSIFESFRDTVRTNEFLQELGAAGIGGFQRGGFRGLAAGALPVIGSAFGPLGGAIGSLVGSLFGGKQRQRGNDPSKPIFVSDINNGNTLTDILNISKAQLTRGRTGGINGINAMIRAQAGTAGAT